MSSGLGSTSCFTPARFLSLVVAASLVLLTFFTFYRHTPHDTDSLHIKPQAVWDDASSWVSNMWQPERPDRKPKPKLELQHTYLSNGLLQTNMEGRHPMMELIEEAERKWESKLNRQSKTLEQARAEYKRRYKLSPPRGFDQWYEFAVSRNFILVDEFDQINRDIAPLFALPRSALRERLKEAKKISESTGFIIDMRPSEQILKLTGPAFSQKRVKLIHSLTLAVSRGLPDLTIYGNGEDRSGRILSGEMRRWIAEDKGEFQPSMLQKFEDPFRDGRRDIFSACLDPPPPTFVTDASEIFKDTNEPPRFIHEPSLASDFCLHPSLAHLHGSLSAELAARGPRLFPEFVFGKMPLGAEILLPDTAGFDSFTIKDARPWSEKTQNKLFWRGQSTGASHRQGRGGPLGWKGGSQRIRAAFTFANATGSAPASFLPTDIPLLLASSTGGLETMSFSRTALNSLYADVGLVRPLIQCSEEDGTCDEMRRDVPWRDSQGVWGVRRSSWKYVLDLDANGHSADFLTSLGLGSVVLKSTIFPHWNSDWLIPYYHYIPIQQDYSDVFNVMAFFAGPPTHDENSNGFHVDGARGHDDLAQKIGENAERFVRTMWRWEDMQVYMYRLLLEYARLVKDEEVTSTDES